MLRATAPHRIAQVFNNDYDDDGPVTTHPAILAEQYLSWPMGAAARTPNLLIRSKISVVHSCPAPLLAPALAGSAPQIDLAIAANLSPDDPVASRPGPQGRQARGPEAAQQHCDPRPLFPASAANHQRVSLDA